MKSLRRGSRSSADRRSIGSRSIASPYRPTSPSARFTRSENHSRHCSPPAGRSGLAAAADVDLNTEDIMLLHSQSAVGSSPAAVDDEDDSGQGRGTFRFWHEERRFKGDGSRCLVQAALFAAGGVRTGGHPKVSPLPGPLGWQRPMDWDLLWGPSRIALKALPRLQPGQLISATPGLACITRKRTLGPTLHVAYGDAAWRITPRSFSLPDQLPAFQEHVRAAQAQAQTQCQVQRHADGTPGEQSSTLTAPTTPTPLSSAAGAAPSTSAAAAATAAAATQPLWMLKTSQHLGEGLSLLEAAAAVQEAQRSLHNKGDGGGGGAAAPRRRRRGQRQQQQQQQRGQPYVTAQQYVSDPLLIDGCKFGLRVWLLITGVDPLRAYLHTNGLALFANSAYDTAATATPDGALPGGHVTNYAQNTDGRVWDLSMLAQRLGDAAWAQLWRQLQVACAMTVAAAGGPMADAHRLLGTPQCATFELLGADFLVDSQLQPWLLEVNTTPSLTVEHEQPAVRELIQRQKNGMVQDMIRLLDCRQRFRPRYKALELLQRTKAAEAAAMLQQRRRQAQAPGRTEATTAAAAAAVASAVATATVAAPGSQAAAGEGQSAKRLCIETGSASGAPTSVVATNGGGDASQLDGTSRGGSSSSSSSSSGVTASPGTPQQQRGEEPALPPAAAARLPAAPAAAKPRNPVPKALRVALIPSSDEAVIERVKQEIASCGPPGFVPLMPLFPYEGPYEQGYTLTWGRRDFQLRDLLLAESSASERAAETQSYDNMRKSGTK